jgi:small subunit ribosomal protein S6
VKRQYELTVVVRLENNEEVMAAKLDEIQGWVQADGYGEIEKVDRWGRRKLAYEVDGQREGYYTLFHVLIDPKGVGELERNLQLDPSVLRYLMIRAGE